MAVQGQYAGRSSTTSTGIRVTRRMRTRGLPVTLNEKEKAMDAKDLRDKTPDELRDQLASLKKEAFNLRFQQATGQMENTSRMRLVRRDVARVKTILNEKAAAAASTEA
jgi:large subunit ribosomal protein L29